MATQLASKEFIQRFLLPLLAKPHRLTTVEIADHRDDSLAIALGVVQLLPQARAATQMGLFTAGICVAIFLGSVLLSHAAARHANSVNLAIGEFAWWAVLLVASSLLSIQLWGSAMGHERADDLALVKWMNQIRLKVQERVGSDLMPGR